MANVTPSQPPASYLNPLSVAIALASAVPYVKYSVNAPAPMISEGLAFDTLTPSTPFIAASQDGNGKVVYDGGFSKFLNGNAGPPGIDPYFSMEYRGTRINDRNLGYNTYYYDLFSRKAVKMAAGDKLIYDVFQNSDDICCAIDATTNNPPASTWYSLRDWGVGVLSPYGIYDQNGVASHPANNLQGRATNKWYHREFDLSTCAGYTFTTWTLAYEGEEPGVFYTRFRDVYIIDKNRKIKATLFKDVIEVPGSDNTETGASGYINTSKRIYDPRTLLTPSFRYLFNAVNWVANFDKTWLGNKSILVLGDVGSADDFSIKSTGDTGFFNSFTNLFQALGYSAVFKNKDDYVGNLLNPTDAELDRYPVVMLMSATQAGQAMLTDAGVQALLKYRANGNGLIVLTDDGPEFTDVTQAYPTPAIARQYFATANKLVTNFGVCFSGSYDRSPVTLRTIRQVSGDHPLWNGIAASESIAASSTEAQILIPPFTKYTQAMIPPISVPAGQTVIRVAAMLTDRSVEAYEFVYAVASGELLKVLDGAGNDITEINTGWGAYANLTAKILGEGLGSLSGQIIKNGARVANLTFSDAQGSAIAWLSGDGTRLLVKQGDVFKVQITTPFAYEKVLNVKRIAPSVPVNFSLSKMMQVLKAAGAAGTTPSALFSDVVKKINRDDTQAGMTLKTFPLPNLAALRSYFAK